LSRLSQSILGLLREALNICPVSFTGVITEAKIREDGHTQETLTTTYRNHNKSIYSIP